MGRVVTFTGPHEAVLADEPEQSLGADEVRVETLYSGISAGTELTEYRGSNPYLHKRWEPEQTAIRLATERRIDVQALVSHVLPAERAPEAFRLLDERPEEAVQVVLAFHEP